MGTPYTPAARFRRTQAERVDQRLSWKRSDQAFFAAGACHVLAWVAVERYASAGFGVVGLRQLGEPYVSHVIISNGRWSFDQDGWTPLPELLRATAEYEPHPSWEQLPITSTLGQFCAAHKSRMPEQYAHDPLPRARRGSVALVVGKIEAGLTGEALEPSPLLHRSPRSPGSGSRPR